MRLLALLFILTPLLVAAAPQTPRVDQIRLNDDTEARWVPFTLTAANQIRFTATIDGRPVAAILDTGVSNSVLSRHYADAMHLKVAPGVEATAVGGATAIGWVDSPHVRFGGLDQRAGRIAVATLPSSATGGEPIDLLVGRELLAPFALEIDYDAARFRLLPSGRLPFHGTELPLSIGGAAPAYRTNIVVNTIPARLIVDTGDGNAITLSAAAWHRAGGTAPTTTTLSYGVGGSIVTGLAVLPSLDLGPLRTGPTEVAIESDDGYSRAAGASGRIGTGFLRRYHVLLDPGAGHMVLAPGRLADAAPPRSTSGLLMVRDGPALRVIHVMRGSPAAEAGWHADDTICSVDGAAIAASPPDATIRWPVGAPGRTVSLRLCDGSVRSLTLRAFY